jgi:hypothetical protein
MKDGMKFQIGNTQTDLFDIGLNTYEFISDAFSPQRNVQCVIKAVKFASY